ncbi:hypothetical protein ACU4GI_32685 [Cupriavidus basilensis]
MATLPAPKEAARFHAVVLDLLARVLLDRQPWGLVLRAWEDTGLAPTGWPAALRRADVVRLVNRLGARVRREYPQTRQTDN